MSVHHKACFNTLIYNFLGDPPLKNEIKDLTIMIPVQTFSVLQFLLFIAPLIGVVLTLGLLVKALFFWRNKAQKPVRFFSQKHYSLR